MTARSVGWRVIHAPLEVAAIVMDAVSDTVNRVCEHAYEKGYPNSWGGPVHIKQTPLNNKDIEDIANRIEEHSKRVTKSRRV